MASGRGSAVCAGCLVKRYFFHVLSGRSEYRDEEGETCASAGDAEGHALFMAKEIYRLLNDDSRRDERVAAISVQVTDEMGNEIIRAPIQLH
jgi:hypothetical protein